MKCLLALMLIGTVFLAGCGGPPATSGTEGTSATGTGDAASGGESGAAAGGEGGGSTAAGSSDEEEMTGSDYQDCLYACNVMYKSQSTETYNVCVGACDTARAISQGTLESCHSLEEGFGKYSCYMDYAIDNEEPSACEHITVEGTKTSCYIAVALEMGDHTICASLGDSADTCYLSVAQETGDLEICSYISSELLSTACAMDLD